jgi:site-specific recombinase XerD
VTATPALSLVEPSLDAGLDVEIGPVAPPGLTLSTYAHRYVTGRRRRGEITAATVANHRGHLGWFVTAHGRRPMEFLGKATVHRWAEATAHLSASTRRGHVSTVRHFLLWMAEEGLCNGKIVVYLPKVKAPREVPRAFSFDDAKAALAAAPDRRGRAIVALMLYEGMRCCEVANLDCEDYDRVRQTLLVTGKLGNQRVLPVGTECAVILGRWLDERGFTRGPVFTSRQHGREGERLLAQTVSKLVADWFTAAGLKMRRGDGRSAHALRHTAASDALDAGVNLRVVQNFLGHQNLGTTSIYLRRAALGDLQAAVERSYQ